MAHHKRRSRRRDKRHMHACGCCYDYGTPARKEPIEDAPCTGKAKHKKPRPKKERCPVNRTHEWYKEIHEEWTPWTPRSWWWNPARSDEYRQYSKTRVETCIHCWKVRKKTLDSRYEYRERPTL